MVVFDKVAENSRDLTATARMTYSEAANLAVNQTLMRSINTSLISLLPVAGLLFVGAGLLGVGTIKDLALILFVGLAVGAYSSLFLATPGRGGPQGAGTAVPRPDQAGAGQAERGGPHPGAEPGRRRGRGVGHPVHQRPGAGRSPARGRPVAPSGRPAAGRTARPAKKRP